MLTQLSWPLFSSTFALIFLAELPDKTAFAVLLLAAQHEALAVFGGAALAFLVQTLVALAFGSVLTLIPASIVHYGAAVLFFAFAVQMWRKQAEPEEAGGTAAKAGFWRSLSTTFLTIFIAEWGDLTQLATATLVAKYHDYLTIGLAALLALWAVTALGAVVGRLAKGLISGPWLQRLGAVAMAGVGVYMLVKG